jgi:hypothetical protein
MMFQDELNALNDGEDEVEENSMPQPKAGPPATSNTELSLVAMLEDRKKMYQDAESNANMAGETSRARR